MKEICTVVTLVILLAIGDSAMAQDGASEQSVNSDESVSDCSDFSGISEIEQQALILTYYYSLGPLLQTSLAPLSTAHLGLGWR